MPVDGAKKPPIQENLPKIDEPQQTVQNPSIYEQILSNSSKI